MSRQSQIYLIEIMQLSFLKTINILLLRIRALSLKLMSRWKCPIKCINLNLMSVINLACLVLQISIIIFITCLFKDRASFKNNQIYFVNVQTYELFFFQTQIMWYFSVIRLLRKLFFHNQLVCVTKCSHHSLLMWRVHWAKPNSYCLKAYLKCILCTFWVCNKIICLLHAFKYTVFFLDIYILFYFLDNLN